MVIAIISDTHDNIANLDKFLVFAGKNSVGAVIHCGDIASGETLIHLADNFSGKIFAVLGNMDYSQSVKSAAQKFPKKISLWEDTGKISIAGLNICFSHFKEKALGAGETSDFDFIFYGHTHKPWLEKSGNCLVANPGNLAGLIYKSTFAVLDAKNKRLELKIVDSLK